MKMTRAEVVKLTAQEMQAQAGEAVVQAREAVVQAHGDFREAAVERARSLYADAVAAGMEAVGRDVEVVGVCSYELGDGDAARVILRDHPLDYEAKFRLVVDVEVLGETEALRDRWSAAVQELRVAEERDTRMTAMSREAREKLIKDSLESTEEGRMVLEAVKKLAKAVRDA